ncbi:MAG: hypothetical protein Q9166_005382 [cf. Caloplaca sp. 2 TL-2023]
MPVGASKPEADIRRHTHQKQSRKRLRADQGEPSREKKRQCVSGPARPTKRQRAVKDVGLSNSDPNRPKHSNTAHIVDAKESFVVDWLSDLSSSRRRKPSNIMPANYHLPSPGSSNGSSKRSDKTTASVADANYRTSLRHRNVRIEAEYPLPELMQRAQEITQRPRMSPEMDDRTFKELMKIRREIQDKGEDELIRQIAPFVIPGFNTLPNSKLARSSNQVWSDSVPVPLAPELLSTPIPLPKPKPDLAFGNSEAAFNRNQLAAIGLLVHDQSGTSYAVPDQCLQFPFLNVEFKSQAKNGTLYIATNQAAGAGAIAMNGYLELMSRSFGLDSFDFNEPLFFSVTMDHKMACLNVHWIRNQAEIGQYSFHLDEVSTHPMDNANSVRDLVRAIKNILEECSDTRLHNLHIALDEYRRRVLAPAPPERQKRGKRAPRNQATGISAAGRREHVVEEGEVEEAQSRPQPHGRSKRTATRQADIPTANVRTRRMAATEL